jgi:hypothetical protein
MSEPVFLGKDYILVIDTNRASYDFAKRLCAYCTGFEHEDSKNYEMSRIFYEEMRLKDDSTPKGLTAAEKNPFYNFVIDRRDEEDFYSPCSVMLNKRYGCDQIGRYAVLTEDNCGQYSYPAPLSVGIFFAEEPTPEHIRIIKERAQRFFELVWPEQDPSKETVVVEGLRLIVTTKHAEEKVLS